MTDKTAAGITLPYKFVPREYQYPFLRYFDTVETRQRAFLLCHRRAGKDVLAWNNLIRMTQRRVGTYWHCLPQLNQARKVIWNGRTKDGISFMDFIPPQLIRSKRDDDMTIRLSNGSMIQLVGADHIDSLVGTNPIGINFSEFALMKPSVWTFLSPILNENDGWAVFVTTPRSTNHAFDMFKSMVQGTKEGKPYFVQVLTVEDTRRALLDKEGEPMLDSKGNKVLVPVIPQEAIQEQRDLNVPEEMIQQEYMCSFESGLVGSYYGAAMRKLEEEGKTKPNPKLWNKKLPVYTSWDLGISDAMAIWYFQYTDAGEINVIEYNEFTEKSLAECACLVRADFKPLREDFGWSDDLIQKAMAQFGHHADYQYASRAFGPHDLAQRDVATGVTRKQVAKKYGINFRAVPKANVAEGIDLVRRMLLKVTFDGDKCLTGIRAMKEYHKEFNEKTQMYDEKPCHDWSSHGCDSFRYLCQGIVAFIDSQAAKASKLQPEADHDYNPLREKAIKMELREMQKLKKRKEGEHQRGLPLFAKCDYNIYDY